MNVQEKIRTMNEAEYAKFTEKVRNEGTKYGIYPLGNNQKGIWSISKVSSGKENPYYNPVFRITVKNGSCAMIKKAAESLWNSQDIFRYKFFEADGEPYQYRDRDAVFAAEEHKAEDNQEKENFEKEFCLRNFDLTAEYPVRFMILETGDSEYILYISVHHIISDGWSDGLICSIFTDFYNDVNTDIGKYQYARYVLNERSTSMQKKRAADMLYWKEQLKKNDGFADMPVSYSRKSDPERRASVLTVPVPENMTVKIREAADRFSCNLHALMLSAFALCMGRYTGKENINFGTTLANRDDMNYWKTVGDFASVIVLPVDTVYEGSVSEYIEYVKDTLFRGMDHSSVILSEVIENTEFTRIDGVNPLYQIIFSVHNRKMLSGMSGEAVTAADGAQIKTENIERASSNFTLDLALVVFDGGDDGMELQAEYCETLFSEKRIRLIFDAFLTVLDNMISDPSQSCESVSAVSENNKVTDGDTCITDRNGNIQPQCFPGLVCRMENGKLTPSGQYGMYDENSLIHVDERKSRIVNIGGTVTDTYKAAEEISEKYGINVISFEKSGLADMTVMFFRGKLSIADRINLYREYKTAAALCTESSTADLRLRNESENIISDIVRLTQSVGSVSEAVYDENSGKAVVFRTSSGTKPDKSVISGIMNSFRTSGLRVGYLPDESGTAEWYSRTELTATQKKVYDIWKDILGENAEFGINDKFFEAGGNSINVLKMLDRLNSEYSVDFNIGELFDCATVFRIAEYIDQAQTTESHSDETEVISF